MNRCVFVFLLFLVGISKSDNSWHKPEHTDDAASPSEHAELKWNQAREADKSSDNTIFVINTDGEEVGSRWYTIDAVCEDGYSMDEFKPSPGSFECKQGPGSRANLKCGIVYGSTKYVRCPNFKYVSAFWISGMSVKLKCCGEEGLSYTDDSCAIHINDDTVNGKIHKISAGKYWTGFGTDDGGITWNNYECSYTNRDKEL